MPLTRLIARGGLSKKHLVEGEKKKMVWDRAVTFVFCPWLEGAGEWSSEPSTVPMVVWVGESSTLTKNSMGKASKKKQKGSGLR